MKILVSTYGGNDNDRILKAMRSLPYERLVLICDKGAKEGAGMRRIAALEEMAGNQLVAEEVGDGGFMEIVDSVSDILVDLRRDKATGRRNEVVLNVSGGSKLLGDASLFAAFRHGVEAYHVDRRVTRLPVLRDATARDRFTEGQVRMIQSLDNGWKRFDTVAQQMGASSKQSAERVLRELRKLGVIKTQVVSGAVQLCLSEMGAEVRRAIVTN